MDRINNPPVHISPEKITEILAQKDYLLLGVVEALEVAGTFQTMVTVEASSPREAMKQAYKIVDNPEYIHAILEIDSRFNESALNTIDIEEVYYNHSEGDEIIISNEP